MSEHLLRELGEAEELDEVLVTQPREHLDLLGDCPGRKPPKWAGKRPARPYKNTIENRITVENAKGA